MSHERKKYGKVLAQNIKALLEERGVKATLISMNWACITFAVDKHISDRLIIEIYSRNDVTHVDYHEKLNNLLVGVDMPPVLGQFV